MKHHIPKPHKTKTNTRIKKMNIEIIKRIISEKKTTLPLLRNQDWNTVKAETEKINELLIHISMNNITKFN